MGSSDKNAVVVNKTIGSDGSIILIGIVLIAVAICWGMGVVDNEIGSTTDV